MKLARYWARERAQASDGTRTIEAASRGWSNDSLDAAIRVARQNADRLARLLLSGGLSSKRYLYGERPLPEPILEEFRADRGDVFAALTRNRYGAVVLNASNTMFIDVDRAHRSAGDGLTGLLMSLFKGGTGTEQERDLFARDVRALTEQDPNLGIRLYRTKAGYRLIVTSHEVLPDSGESERLLELFQADPLYRKLCKQQNSFRARLSPKPWRCGVAVPPVEFPFRDSAERERFSTWLAQYEQAGEAFATCALVGCFGNARVFPIAQQIVSLHDRLCHVHSEKPLA